MAIDVAVAKSHSYGYDESALSTAYEERQCNEYMKLGLMGVSILYSSGDYGVAGNGGACSCMSPRYGVAFTLADIFD